MHLSFVNENRPTSFVGLLIAFHHFILIFQSQFLFSIFHFCPSNLHASINSLSTLSFLFINFISLVIKKLSQCLRLQTSAWSLSASSSLLRPVPDPVAWSPIPTYRIIRYSYTQNSTWLRLMTFCIGLYACGEFLDDRCLWFYRVMRLLRQHRQTKTLKIARDLGRKNAWWEEHLLHILIISTHRISIIDEEEIFIKFYLAILLYCVYVNGMSPSVIYSSSQKRNLLNFYLFYLKFHLL